MDPALTIWMNKQVEHSQTPALHAVIDCSTQAKSSLAEAISQEKPLALTGRSRRKSPVILTIWHVYLSPVPAMFMNDLSDVCLKPVEGAQGA